MIELQLGQSLIQVWPDAHYLHTVYRDGTLVRAAPEDTDSYREMASRLGYQWDTWRMCLEHEVFHTLLAMAAGRCVSPTLWIVAHGSEAQYNSDLVVREEEAVLEFQRKYNECFR